MPNNPKMCPMPFASMHIDPDGRIKICCADTPDTIPVDSEGRPYNVTTHKLSDFWNSEYVRSIRREFISGGQPKSCNNCWKNEVIDEKSSSVRLASIHRLKNENQYDYEKVIEQCNSEGYVTHSPVDFQVMVGNLCNLGCKMCSPLYSTNFSKFFKSKGFKTLSSIKFSKHQPLKYFENTESSYNITYDWAKTVSLSTIFSEYSDNIKEIFITGGEPTIVKENIEFLSKLSSSHNAKNTIIQLSTNCTNINKKILSSMENFKFVRINCSIDGMDKIADIQRTYSDWNQISKNLNKLYDWKIKKQNRGIYIHSVLSALNIHHIIDFWVYISKQYDHREIWVGFMPIVNKINPLGLELIPKRFREKLLKKINVFRNAIPFKESVNQLYGYVEALNFSDNDEDFFELLEFIQKLHPEYNIKEIYQFYYE
jgi:organic radical activating enzyme